MATRTFRYDTSGQWLKGNTHIHSTASDGGMTFKQIEALYAGAGYDFLYATDHCVASSLQDDPHADQAPLIWLDGMEIHGTDSRGSAYHVACLGPMSPLSEGMSFDDMMEQAKAEGAMRILAHPFWMGNSFEDALHWQFDGVEVYNHVCRWLNGKGDGGPYWHAMLAHAPAMLSLAVDDAHLTEHHPGWNGGWIVVNTPEPSPTGIAQAIRRGNYYSSCGPEFHRIERKGDQVCIQTSEIQLARLVGPASQGSRAGSFDGELMTEVTFASPADWRYAFIEIEDRTGQRAWTNTLFVEG